ncbi:hypothetical protein [Bacillus pseudomycoides]|uniref:hypothetical protein n=1 Tax=Bacillus pseudomycoides TaxID=64104 RepID=UPI000BF05A0B|nr:hypothetical protein [Bacillus pseudomycoides]PEJ27086.1 hypothetical protein CN677_28030 [Bacillus pseudomycoides]PHA97924.1 hypothetical protein COE78_02825 [Bacillus pseudomycoides]PHC71419.1 hypothetical protein COF38_23700 [Bacillus pseudomycoides]
MFPMEIKRSIPTNKATCEWCNEKIKKGEWVINSSEFGLFHESCYKEYLANEFPHDHGIWGEDVTEKDVSYL